MGTPAALPARLPVHTINGNHFLFSSNADAEKSVVRRWHAPPASADIRDCISIRNYKCFRFLLLQNILQDIP